MRVSGGLAVRLLTEVCIVPYLTGHAVLYSPVSSDAKRRLRVFLRASEWIIKGYAERAVGDQYSAI